MESIETAEALALSLTRLYRFWQEMKLARVASKRVVVAGGSGFVGRHLCRALNARGHEVFVVSRQPTANVSGDGLNYTTLGWNDMTNKPQPFPCAIDAVVNLCGQPVMAKRPWTPAFAQTVRDSRVGATNALVRAIARTRASERPSVMVTATGVGYYPPSATAADAKEYDETYDGANRPAHERDHWSDLVTDWESAANAVTTAATGVRAVNLRTGVVLGHGGGIFAETAWQARWGLAMSLGSGVQARPWIHAADWASLCVLAIENASLSGAVNATSPDQVTCDEWTACMADAYGRKPLASRVSAELLNALLGPVRASMLLLGQKVVPKKAVDAGFRFQFAGLQKALGECRSHE